MSKPARILIADVPDGLDLLAKSLVGYRIEPATTLGEATRLLSSQKYDLVICGVHFDESHMVELLRAVSNNTQQTGTPVIVFRGTSSDHPEILRRSVEALRKVQNLGPYLEIDQLPNIDQFVALLRKSVEDLLPQELIAKNATD